MLATWVLCLLREVKGDLKKEGQLNEAGREGFVGISQAEVRDGEERKLCSTPREQHEPKLRGESANYMSKCVIPCVLGLEVSDSLFTQ